MFFNKRVCMIYYKQISVPHSTKTGVETESHPISRESVERRVLLIDFVRKARYRRPFARKCETREYEFQTNISGI